jgi:hypothetical protein
MSWCIKTCWVTGISTSEFWRNQHIVVDYFEHDGVYRVREKGGWATYGSSGKGGSGCVLCCTPEPLCFFILVGGPILLITMLWDILGRFDTNETLEVGLEPLTYMTELIK